ncbi:hypothetical protein [Heyndrickxia acidicola]|uniref:Uncharacterized protein n=1 Tax=Heyndrickxia acidicola TaxID=209389 RepID=A0ABU6MHJ8_9BACI|nr:hypothetical protein [Heyndrickxia acidicola]MED1202530.1 hypothetical protein [Heyndrickxia acidicola]
MRKKIYLTKATETKNALELSAENAVSLQNIKGTGRVIVDSDSLAFVYLAEDDQDYTYIYLPEAVWPEVHAAIENQKTIEAIFKDGRMELVQLKEELQYLIENIEGNSNYGEEMVSKVEAIFGSNS